jgi:DNA helicase-2/ATP-dependent DNA helicase PcrA
MMTIHAAKGLEFPVVFMVGMEEGVFPLARASFEASELEEERRLAYVGMTRAREELMLTAASERLLYGNYQHNLPSRFLGDIDAEFERSGDGESSGDYGSLRGFSRRNPDDDGTTGLLRSARNDSDDVTFVPDPIELEIGDQVRHKIFGTGTVQGIDGSVVAVRFSTGIKKLNVAFAPLEKL